MKVSNEMDDPVAQINALAAVEWIKNANSTAGQGDGKQRRYALIPDNAEPFSGANSL